MTSRWYYEELARIGVREIEILHERDGIQETHLAGCLCSWCSEVRAAVGGGRRTDKHIARTMTAREAGRRAAEQEITAQAHREGAAMAEVTRELAGYGAYPYRVSDGDGECTCGRYAVQVWAAHQIGCPRRAALIETMKENAARPIPEPAPPAPDPVAQWWEVTRSLILPDPGRAFTAIPDQPPGTCKDCRTGPLFKGNQCWYCHALSDLAITPQHLTEPARDGMSPVCVILVLLLAAVVFWLGAYLIWTGALTP